MHDMASEPKIQSPYSPMCLHEHIKMGVFTQEDGAGVACTENDARVGFSSAIQPMSEIVMCTTLHRLVKALTDSVQSEN